VSIFTSGTWAMWAGVVRGSGSWGPLPERAARLVVVRGVWWRVRGWWGGWGRPGWAWCRRRRAAARRCWCGRGSGGVGGWGGWGPAGWGGGDPRGFWLSVLAALRQTGPGPGLVRAVTAAPDLDGWAITERLLADLAPLAGRVWLVVDDAHELGAEA